MKRKFLFAIDYLMLNLVFWGLRYFKWRTGIPTIVRTVWREAPVVSAAVPGENVH